MGVTAVKVEDEAMEMVGAVAMEEVEAVILQFFLLRPSYSAFQSFSRCATARSYAATYAGLSRRVSVKMQSIQLAKAAMMDSTNVLSSFIRKAFECVVATTQPRITSASRT